MVKVPEYFPSPPSLPPVDSAAEESPPVDSVLEVSPPPLLQLAKDSTKEAASKPANNFLNITSPPVF